MIGFANVFVAAASLQLCLALQYAIEESDGWRHGPRVGSSGKMHCFAHGSSSLNHKFMSEEEAKESCAKDQSCNFIWSRTCDGKWAKCEISIPVDAAGDESSCTKLKPANLSRIGQRKQVTAAFSRRLSKSKQASGDDLVDWRLCDVPVHSNLGGLGPDGGDAEIRFSDVAATSSGSIDLVVTNRTEYAAKSTDNNGEKDCFGLINILSPSSVELSFRFVASGTSESVQLPLSYFTVYDIDESKKGMQEEVTFTTAVSAYWLQPTSELVTTGSAEGGLTFTSSVTGTGGDNPSNPENLTLEEQNRAVTVEYNGVDEYILTFSAIGEAQSKVGGRNFMFAGRSDLTVDAEEHDCEAGSCEVWADPHVSGFDNKAAGPIAFIGTFMSTFDVQPVDVNAYETGDFWLVKNDLVRIQGRYQLSAEFGGNRAAVGALAVGGPFIDGSKLLIYPKSGRISWNEELLGENNKFELGSSTAPVIVNSYYNATHEHGTAPSGVDVQLPLGVFLKVRRYNTHLDLKITTPKLPGGVEGQCGNFNGDASDDSLEHIKSRMHGLTVPSSELLFSA